MCVVKIYNVSPETGFTLFTFFSSKHRCNFQDQINRITPIIGDARNKIKISCK